LCRGRFASVGPCPALLLAIRVGRSSSSRARAGCKASQVSWSINRSGSPRGTERDEEHGADLTYAWPIARFSVEASALDYRKMYDKGIEEETYDAYLNRSRKEVDVFDAAYTWTAQIVDEIIEPKHTPRKIIEALAIIWNKVERLPRPAKCHGSPPT